MKLLFAHRKPRPYGNFSIENYFQTLSPFLEKEAELEHWQAPYFSNGIISRYLSVKALQAKVEKWRPNITHIIGDSLNTYVVSKHTQAAGFKIALSGIRGDEWFLGYHYFTALDALMKKQVLSHLSSFTSLLPLRYRKAMEVLANLDTGAAAYSYQCILFDCYTVQKAFGLPLPKLQPSAAVWPDTMSARSVEEWRYYTQPVLLRDTDQYSMAVGLELRAPFTDQDVVNFALSLPDDIKRSTRSIYLLIEAFKDLLPTSVYERKKQGFILPWEHWMRHKLKEFCQTRIATFAQRIDAPQLNTEWAQFVMCRGQWSWSRLWSIVA